MLIYSDLTLPLMDLDTLPLFPSDLSRVNYYLLLTTLIVLLLTS